MNADHNMKYPDFEQMWNGIQQDELKMVGEPIELLPRKRKRFVLVAGLAVALMATPVYAALNYDWSTILSYRAGIQSALDQGLGQTIEKSVTKDGFTLTVHTAFIDDNRTFLLYSLKPEASWDGMNVSFDQSGFKMRMVILLKGITHIAGMKILVFSKGILRQTGWQIIRSQTLNF